MGLKRFFKRMFDADPVPRRLYRRIVEQARQPLFYARWGVPDTVEGRFDMITLHMFLVLDRLRRAKDETATALAQDLFDEMFLDMDHNLREIGVSDVAVGGKVRKMAEAFFGRLAAYRSATEANDEEALKAALRRNIYGGDIEEGALAALAAYVRSCQDVLCKEDVRSLMKGEVRFPDPEDGGSGEKSSRNS